MKELLGKYALKSILFGAIMTVCGFFNGWVRYPLDETHTLLPVPVQLLRIFFVCGGTFLLVFALGDQIAAKYRQKKK